MNWTDEQRSAIETTGTNILLSAAAGSGKTTVLVERVLHLIETEGASLDRMLIVTFTRPAASDMRAKLAKKLGELAQRDDRFREQELRLEQASISTIHGFCSEFLRSHFEIAGVDPAFTILDDTIQAQLLDEAVEEVLEQAYTDRIEEMKQLDRGRRIAQLRIMLKQLYAFLAAREEPEAWLDYALEPDRVTEALGVLYDETRRILERLLRQAAYTLDSTQLPPGYVETLSSDMEVLQSLMACEDCDSLQRACKEPGFARLKTVRGADPEIKKRVTDMRDAMKKAVKESPIAGLPVAQAIEDMRAQQPQLRLLGELALAVGERFREKKQDRAGLTYDDLERCTLTALKDPSAAVEMRERFDYIFVDEYQDTSELQDAIARLISRGDNRFMVGDVKQSIYRFRQAEPRLFLKKYEDYRAHEGGTLLPLTRNFRSEPAVLDFVNLVFEHAMAPGCSEIVYDELARLNPGLSGTEKGHVELHLLTKSAPEGTEVDDAIADMKDAERQAVLIAKLIREAREQDPTLNWRDFAILTRNKSQSFSMMLPILLAGGIPAYADGATGFFDAPEIMWLRSVLRLIDNPRNDLCLIGVLRSPVVGLSADELAAIRIAFPHEEYCDAARCCAGGRSPLTGRTAQDVHLPEGLRDRLSAFFTALDSWRLRNGSVGLGELTRTVLEESGFYMLSGAMPGGGQRRANLDRFVADAARFDRESSGSLTRFLRYLDSRVEKGGDQDIAHLLGENDDVVRMMTMHKSKGLEFRVVFGARLERRYLRGAAGNELMAQPQLGFTMKYYDAALNSRRDTILQKAISITENNADAEEEKRLLYVMLTRAKERLILLGSVPDDEEARTKRWTERAVGMAVCGSHLDVIMAARRAAELEDRDPLSSLQVHTPDELPSFAGEQNETRAVFEEIVADPERFCHRELEEAIDWVYPDAVSGQKPLKLTVSGLLRDLQGPRVLPQLAERPEFLKLQGARRATGAERGTAYHRALQLLVLSELREATGQALTNAISAQLDRFVAGSLMTPVQRELVQPARLSAFLVGETGRRLLAAEEVHREWSFTLSMRAHEVLTPEEAGRFADTDISVQGTIDCCFLEEGEWVLLDYKTDRSDDEQALAEHYRKQLQVYALALERITGRPVRDRLLCLLGADRVLRI